MKDEIGFGPDWAGEGFEGQHPAMSRRGFLAAALSTAAVSVGNRAHAGESPKLQGQSAAAYAWEYAYVYVYE
ncbi:MAG: hypothetical protein KJ947_18070 [Alphaproteobacteria bacterium]|nr:hypothetical protein [Alphaproteobacteria bacterium]MBU1551460.1 hypothetical protein [Alphaproteobacteria bacterium]MBU2334704.1 hypothetical protein [Alphaproteobacteria bacterium]MBU2386426.1 hypothetical protein [Alphaproteobacteria bacterium]